MDRALDPTLLGGALGDIGNLPTVEELRQMLAEAEVSAFFAQDHELPPTLVATAWVLHQVGTVRPALQIYGLERQVQSNAVAAHIFDLALARGPVPGEELVVTFAAQVSSIRGDRTPNATALAGRLPVPRASVVSEPGRASLEVGCSLPSLVRADTAALLRRLSSELGGARDSQGIAGTPLAAAAAVVFGSRLLLRYLTYGDGEDLAGARDAYERGVNDVAARRDLDSRWVAAHLLDLADDLGQSSVWAILPAGTPPVVGRAMTLGEPPVMMLWPPQVALLHDDVHNPLRPDVRRSGGIATALGAPRSFDSWGFGLFLIGFVIGWPIASVLAMGLVERSPRALGGVVVVWAIVVGAAMVADRSGWDTRLVLFAPAALRCAGHAPLAIALTAVRTGVPHHGRGGRSAHPPRSAFGSLVRAANAGTGRRGQLGNARSMSLRRR